MPRLCDYDAAPQTVDPIQDVISRERAVLAAWPTDPLQAREIEVGMFQGHEAGAFNLPQHQLRVSVAERSIVKGGGIGRLLDLHALEIQSRALHRVEQLTKL